MAELNQAQKQAARALLRTRPPVLPGTRAILNDRLRLEWFDKVTAEGMRVDAYKSPDLIKAFCDLAGVPD